MTQANKLPSLISQEQLIKMAGQDCFDLGLSLSQTSSISKLIISENKVTADIDNNHIVLNFHEKQLQGACTCPRSDGFDFCEHCVCLCLNINKQNQQIRSLAKGPDKSKILSFLLSLDKKDLAKQCLNLITEDTNEFERYLLKASLHQEEIDYSQLKAQVTNLTRKPENLFSQRQVKIFFGKLERFLAELSTEDAPIFDVDKMQKVVEYTFQRLNILLVQIDDSTEQRSDCLIHLGRLYFDLLNKKICRDDTLAKHFFNFWVLDRFDLLGIQAANNLSAAVEQKFKNLALANFTQKPTQNKSQSDKQTKLNDWQKVKLARYLFEEAIQSHDILLANKYRRFFSKD
ncbi:MAG: hypothetical protein ACI8O8_001088 [Oleiphilaceae bacterium]|jgi:hypothetical protein